MPVTLPPFGLPWAMLDRDARHTGHSNTVGPYDPSVLGLPWPYKTGGPIFASPAIDYAGTAYVGSEDGWLHAVGFNGKGSQIFMTNGPIQTSPALIEETLSVEGQVVAPSAIYFGSDDGQIYSILPNGTLRWALAPGIRHRSPIRSSPVVTQLPSGERWVYVGADNGQLYAILETISPATPPTVTVTTAWEIRTAAPLRTSPALSPLGDVIYIGASDGRLYCVDAFTGTPLASSPVRIRGGALTTPAVDSAGNVYVANATGTLFAFDPAGGSIWQVPLGASISAPPTLGLGGEVLVIADDILYAVSATGTILWSEAFPNHPLGAAAPTVDSAGTVYVASTDGWVFGVRRYPTTAGSRLSWSVQVHPAEPTLTTPVLDAHGRVYVGALDSQLYVIDEVPAFQIAFHSDLSAASNVDIHSLREIYGVLDPARTLQLTDNPALDQQPAYSLDRSVMTYVSDRSGSKDVFLATAIATDEENLTGPGSPISPISAETDPAFTPINDLTGVSRPPHLKPYLALTSNESGLNRLVFIDLAAQASGSIVSQSFTDWAISLGVPNLIILQLEPPNTEQSQIAFSPDGKKIAWRHCVPSQQTGEVKLLFLQGATSQLTGVGPNYHYDPESLQPCGDEPCFSPDSNWIGVREGPSLAIYDVLAGTAVVFTTPKSPVGIPTHPNWSPDGSEIAIGLNTGKLVNLFVASGSGYGIFSKLKLPQSRTSDEPFYHYFKMPPPQALRLSPNQQFPGATIEILGRGFDILHPENNKVFFTDTQRRPELREATILSATVNPKAGLGVLTVRVPNFAGHGPVIVETRFGSSSTPEFHVLPMPTKIVQPRSVPGAKVRVFGLGFDLSQATQNKVSFTAAIGGFVSNYATVGGLDGAEEFLIVEVPPGIAETGSIRVDNLYGGSVSPGIFTQLHPTFTIRRTTGLPQYALQGSPGVPVSLVGTDFPFDPFFGYGGASPLSIANVDIFALVAPLFPSVRIGTLAFSADSPDTARFGPTTFAFPGLGPTYPGGDLSIRASDANLPAASARAPFQIPLTNIPIIFVPGTSGSSLDIAAGTLPPDLFVSAPDSHAFPWLSKTSPPGTPYGPLVHPIPVVFPLNPGLIDPQHGPRVWAGPEAAATLVSLALVPPPAGNIGNHYLDAVAFNSNGTPMRPEIVPGTVFSEVAIVPPDPITGLGGISIDVYKSLIDFLTQPNSTPSWSGRPLCNGINPTTPTTGTEACFDVSTGTNGSVMSGSNAVYLFNLDWRDNNRTQAARLNTFIDTILGRADVMAAGITKVVVIAHSYGAPVTRSYYLDPANGAQSKVDQVISFGGGFSGVLVPLSVLESGDTWGKGFGFGPLSVGIAEWETKALAQNWPTAYFQLPNSQSWFSDHGKLQPNDLGELLPLPINRAYVRDYRSLPFFPPAPGDIATYAESMNWIGLLPDRIPNIINGAIPGATRHNTFVTADQIAFFASPSSTPINLGDFTSGTGKIYHHRIIGKGLMTTVGSAVTLGPSKAGVDPFAYGIFDPAMILLENVPTEHTVPVHGDGDGTVPYHGAIGLTSASDDRIYIVDKGQHDALINNPPALSQGSTRGLLQLLLEGMVCSQPQAPASFLQQNEVTEIMGAL